MVASSSVRRVALIVLLLSSASALADTISIRADEWLPYNGPQSKKPAGYMIEAAEKIAAANGHTIKYATMPWDDAVAAVRRGAHDCVVGALKADAEGFAFPAEPGACRRAPSMRWMTPNGATTASTAWPACASR
jgi:ABC-type amino acid transport substrate-binding protein